MKIKDVFKKIFEFSKNSMSFELEKDNEEIIYDIRREKNEEVPKISKNYDKNVDYIKKRFDYPHNNDVVMREIELAGSCRAVIVFYDGMCDGNSINDGIIKPLLELPAFTEN